MTQSPLQENFSSRRPCCPGRSVYSAVPLENLIQAQEMSCVKVRLLSLLATLFRNLDSEEAQEKKKKLALEDMTWTLFCFVYTFPERPQYRHVYDK